MHSTDRQLFYAYRKACSVACQSTLRSPRIIRIRAQKIKLKNAARNMLFAFMIRLSIFPQSLAEVNPRADSAPAF